MKHQEIVKLLREIDDYAKAGAGVPIRVWRCAGEVADAVEQMENEITRLREERRWIPVGERLPEPRLDVLVVEDNGEMIVASVNERGVWGHAFGSGNVTNGQCWPTHWMPLPAPPNGGEVEE